MTITMEEVNGEVVVKVCRSKTGDTVWMDILTTVMEGLRGFGYHLPEDKEVLWRMLKDYMEENE